MDHISSRDRLMAWAEINSGSGNRAGLQRMCARLASEFGALPGAKVEPVALEGTEAPALRVRLRPGAPTQILLSGHYDTVYGPDHPFQHCTLLDENTLRGPGVLDMKGGLLVILAALQEFEHGSSAKNLGFEVLFTPDEETGSVASRPLIEATAHSGRFGFALVFEPARVNGDLVQSRKGTGIFTVTCRGRAAHAGRGQRAGRNAIVALAELLPAIHALNDQLPGVLVNAGSISGGGPVNIIPDFAAAQIDVRIDRAADAPLVVARLRELAAPLNAREGYQLEISGGFNRPPKELKPAEEKLFAAWQTCGRELGLKFNWQHAGGGSDGNLLSAAGLANLDGLGPIGDHLHSADEFVHLPSIAERAQLAARFFQKIATGEIEV